MLTTFCPTHPAKILDWNRAVAREVGWEHVWVRVICKLVSLSSDNCTDRVFSAATTTAQAYKLQAVYDGAIYEDRRDHGAILQIR